MADCDHIIAYWQGIDEAELIVLSHYKESTYLKDDLDQDDFFNYCPDCGAKLPTMEEISINAKEQDTKTE